MTTIANDLLSTEQRVTTSVTVLQSQPYVAATAQGWHREAYNDVSERLANETGFPCVFSKNAIRKGLLKFIFVEGNGLQDMKRLARGLMAFVEVSSDWNGDLNTAYPLVVAFSENAISARRVEEYVSYGLAVSYETEDWKVTTGIRYIDIGDADSSVTSFSNNDAISAGMKVAYKF